MKITVEEWKRLEAKGRRLVPKAKKTRSTPAKMAPFSYYVMSQGDALTKAMVVLPYRLVTLENQREHWRTKAKRAKLQREGVFGALFGVFKLPPAQVRPNDMFRVTMTRLGPRRLDRGNIEGSFKHCQDGVADWLGIDDGSERIEWEYLQEKSGAYGVRVEIERKAAA